MSYGALSLIDGSRRCRSTSGGEQDHARWPARQAPFRRRQQQRVGQTAAAGVTGNEQPLRRRPPCVEGDEDVGGGEPSREGELRREPIVGDEHRASGLAAQPRGERGVHAR